MTVTSQSTLRTRALAGVLGLSFGLLLALPALAGDEYPAPGYFLGALTRDSSWDAITKTPGVKPGFPYVAFGSTFVPLSSVCVDGDMLAIADPRVDTGVRVVSAEPLRAQVEASAAAGGYLAEPGGRLAAAATPDVAPQVVMRYPVSVYKVTELGIRRAYVFLFDKLWPISACPAK
jgi:hypothetical protein